MASSELLRTAIVASVMFAMALPISWSQVGRSLRQPWPAIVAVLLNMLALPLLAFVISRWLDAPAAGGLIVASTVPCTLASAAVWTRRAGGDDTVSIMVTLITTSTCFLVAPFWIMLFLGKSIEIDAWRMIFDLAASVLLPMVLAQVVASNRSISSLIQKRKSLLSLFCQLGILWMVLIGAVQIGLRTDRSPDDGWLPFIYLVALCLALHTIVLAAGWWLSDRLQFSRSQKIAVAIAGSQKTLMIGLKLAVDCGVSILPMVIYHVGQLIIDAALVERWSKRSASTELAAENTGVVATKSE